jgi:hypothetical protein
MPPLRKAKMMRFAFAGKCGERGASGSADDASAAINCWMMPGKSIVPPTIERSAERRVRDGYIKVAVLIR